MTKSDNLPVAVNRGTLEAKPTIDAPAPEKPTVNLARLRALAKTARFMILTTDPHANIKHYMNVLLPNDHIDSAELILSLIDQIETLQRNVAAHQARPVQLPAQKAEQPLLTCSADQNRYR